MKRLFTEVLTGLMDDRKEADVHREYKQRETKTKGRLEENSNFGAHEKMKRQRSSSCIKSRH